MTHSSFPTPHIDFFAIHFTPFPPNIRHLYFLPFIRTPPPCFWYLLTILQHEACTLLFFCFFPTLPFSQCYIIHFTVRHRPFLKFLSVMQHHMPLMDLPYLHGIRKLVDTIIFSPQLDFQIITFLNSTTLHIDDSFSPYSTLCHPLRCQLHSGFSPSHSHKQRFACHTIFSGILHPHHSLLRFTHSLSDAHRHLYCTFNHTFCLLHHSISLWIMQRCGNMSNTTCFQEIFHNIRRELCSVVCH